MRIRQTRGAGSDRLPASYFTGDGACCETAARRTMRHRFSGSEPARAPAVRPGSAETRFARTNPAGRKCLPAVRTTAEPDPRAAGATGLPNRRNPRPPRPPEPVKSIETTGGRPTRRDRQTRREGLRDKGIARPSEPSKPPGASDLQGQRTRKRMPPSSNAGLPQTGRTSPSNAS